MLNSLKKMKWNSDITSQIDGFAGVYRTRSKLFVERYGGYIFKAGLPAYSAEAKAIIYLRAAASDEKLDTDIWLSGWIREVQKFIDDFESNAPPYYMNGDIESQRLLVESLKCTVANATMRLKREAHAEKHEKKALDAWHKEIRKRTEGMGI